RERGKRVDRLPFRDRYRQGRGRHRRARPGPTVPLREPQRQYPRHDGVGERRRLRRDLLRAAESARRQGRRRGGDLGQRELPERTRGGEDRPRHGNDDDRSHRYGGREAEGPGRRGDGRPVEQHAAHRGHPPDRAAHSHRVPPRRARRARPMIVHVRDYMILEVEHLRSTTTIREAIGKLTKSRHHGLPVTDESGKLVGFVSAKELLRHSGEGETPIAKIIRPGTYTAYPETGLDDAARIMFRFGLRDLPIIDERGRLCGILSNLDVVRSHFERASPMKADTLKRLLSERYALPFSFRRGLVPISRLTPIQWKVFEDELEGRRYELERGFAEPVLVVQKGEEWILVDGHHRALAAREMGLTQLQAFILTCDRPEEFATKETGFERIAKEHHLTTVEDIEIDRASHHPLIEVTTQLIRRFEGGSSSDTSTTAH